MKSWVRAQENQEIQVRAKENQEKWGQRGGKTRKAMLQQRKTKNSEIRDEENHEKRC